MKVSLKLQGETMYDLIQEEIDNGPFWVNDNGYILVHLDPDVRKNLKINKSLRKGFVNISKFLWSVLRQKEFPPQKTSSGAVTTEASGHQIPRTT
jgi:hypothetical protein